MPFEYLKTADSDRECHFSLIRSIKFSIHARTAHPPKNWSNSFFFCRLTLVARFYPRIPRRISTYLALLQSSRSTINKKVTMTILKQCVKNSNRRNSTVKFFRSGLLLWTDQIRSSARKNKPTLELVNLQRVCF